MENTAVSPRVMSPSLRERIKNSQSKEQVAKQSEANLEIKSDVVEIESELDKQEKKGPSGIFSNIVWSVKKKYVNLEEYLKGGVKGVLSFFVGGVATVGSIFAVHKIRQGAKLAKDTGENKMRAGLKHFVDGVSKKLEVGNIKKTFKTAKGIGTLVAGVAVGVLAFLFQIYKARLAVNQKTAELDHKYYDNPHNLSKQVGGNYVVCNQVEHDNCSVNCG